MTPVSKCPKFPLIFSPPRTNIYSPNVEYVSMISNRYAKANNLYFDKGYDKHKPNNCVMYFDCNNLYGYAMSEPLPTGTFRFVDQREIENFDVLTKMDEDAKKYILEVELEYPAHLHHKHNDYPLAPENIAVKDHMLSTYMHEIAKELDLNRNNRNGIKKLIPNFYPKNNYVIHCRNLIFYLQMGLILVKTHRFLEFEQSKWLKPYIDFNTEKRKAAISAFEKDLFKLVTNSVYAKPSNTLESTKTSV